MSVEQTFGPIEHHSAATLVTMALMEDLGDRGDLTCQALIPPSSRASVNVVARKAGVLAGSPIGRMVFAQLDREIEWVAVKSDGDRLSPGHVVATVSGSLNGLLVGERTMLNFMTHLSGIATLTAQFVERITGTQAVILDTRKTLPGYRRLEKYAVRCGGGTNHRMGLYDGVLIKDNHLAAWTANASIASAVRTAREKSPPGTSIEVEVDTLDQLRDALQGHPDIVLLDNMTTKQMCEAVSLRNAAGPGVLLEASGGVTLETVRAIAETGVDRISIGGLTHSAPALDLAFDWKEPDDAFVI